MANRESSSGNHTGIFPIHNCILSLARSQPYQQKFNMSAIVPNFILLDAARMKESVTKAKQLNPVNQSLYKEKNERPLASVSPYLFTHLRSSTFESWFFENGWGNSWGLFINANCSFDRLHYHLRKFLMVRTEDKEQIYFRFYDPRVLRIFLPTCDKYQIVEFFGPIKTFIMESEEKEMAIEFTHNNGILERRMINSSELF
jgi:hypothetical protein